MVSISAPSWTTRLIGLGIFANCFLFYYLFSTPAYPEPHRTSPDDFPWFPSHPYVEVVYPEDPATWPYRAYKSSPFTPPFLTITANEGELADGYLFFTPKSRQGNALQQSLPVIMSQDNELVYCFDYPGGPNDFRVQEIRGKPHLTVWQGHSKHGHGFGEWLYMDDGYVVNKIRFNGTAIHAKLKNPPPNFLDFHEHEVTPWGSVLVSVYNTTQYNLTALGGRADGWINDSQFYEIDIATNEVLFRWSALAHFNVSQSRLPLPSYLSDGSESRPHDFFHLNSIQALGDDAFLVSSRHYWACYAISRATGEVLWELNGSGEPGAGSFGALPAEGQFRWAHHARAHNVTDSGFDLGLFDNHNTDGDANETSTRGLLLRVSTPPDASVAPAVLRNIQPPKRTYVESQGSYDAALSNGNQLMAYGLVPVIREYGPGNASGDVRWEGRFGHDSMAQSYRVFKAPWRATPRKWPPALVFEKDGDGALKAYVSWNGATDVEYWNVYDVELGVRITPLGKAAARGFETVIDIPRDYSGSHCIIAVAVQQGKEVKQSNRACYDLQV
ncbi:hypothetical protein QQZ08_010663 [Neonectria magnoliae]|uniref:ASST-domain-containing protein n=1 Tax=Neonectria magnoliae TaxID=2732573 RepID=A0ABR1HFC1_9HYPO